MRSHSARGDGGGNHGSRIASMFGRSGRKQRRSKGVHGPVPIICDLDLQTYPSIDRKQLRIDTKFKDTNKICGGQWRSGSILAICLLMWLQTPTIAA